MKLHQKLFLNFNIKPILTVGKLRWLKDFNLNESVLKFHESVQVSNPSNGKNHFLDPAVCQRFLDFIHKTYNVDFSYGGYMEDRSTVWKGSYLETDQKFTHLGIDYNVPEGTEVYSVSKGIVSDVYNDKDRDGGWGTKVTILTKGVFLLYGHLSAQKTVKKGQAIEEGELIGKVGTKEENGGWYPHLHLQCVSQYVNPKKIDGYARKEDANSKLYPNPEALF